MIRAPAHTLGSSTMSRLIYQPSFRDRHIMRWEDDGGCFQPDVIHRDLNSLLALEQTSIMKAESAATQKAYEFHRDTSRNTRRLVDATSYPEHGAHIFAREREAVEYDGSPRALAKALERDENLLAHLFANGEVSSKAYQTRSRFLRQDRTRISDISSVAHTESSP